MILYQGDYITSQLRVSIYSLEPGICTTDLDYSWLDFFSNKTFMSIDIRQSILCDWACKNQPCKHKLHLITFLLISPVQNVVSFHFRKLQKKIHYIIKFHDRAKTKNQQFLVLRRSIFAGPFTYFVSVNNIEPGFQVIILI